jgi:hypothetical protein
MCKDTFCPSTRWRRSHKVKDDGKVSIDGITPKIKDILLPRARVSKQAKRAGFSADAPVLVVNIPCFNVGNSTLLFTLNHGVLVKESFKTRKIPWVKIPPRSLTRILSRRKL